MPIPILGMVTKEQEQQRLASEALVRCSLAESKMQKPDPTDVATVLAAADKEQKQKGGERSRPSSRNSKGSARDGDGSRSPDRGLSTEGNESMQHFAELAAEQKNALRVVDATPAAFKHGVQTGMTVAAARSRLPSVETELLDPVSEETDLQALTEQLLRISPVIAPLPPNSMVAEISRQPESRAGHERALVERIRIRMNQLGHNARIVVASDPHTALTVAQWRPGTRIILPGEERTPSPLFPLQPLTSRSMNIPF